MVRRGRGGLRAHPGAIEVVAAYLLVGLFTVGVFDLALRIAELVRTGAITDPQAVVDLIEVALLLFIVVEIYQTVVAYTQEQSARAILRTVIYAGIIAMIRKVIVFRVDEYPAATDALAAATAYLLLIVGLAALLSVSTGVE